ncbi:MAG: hypothetical protein EOM58_11015, partial [Clostridia bacterium]|nr:hypothetical protein [Clostridia bacterium]
MDGPDESKHPIRPGGKWSGDIRDLIQSKPTISTTKNLRCTQTVFLRFFKIAYFDTFVATITFFDEDESVVPEPVPVNFIRPTIEPQTFQNLPLQNEFSPSAYFSDNLIMSRA